MDLKTTYLGLKLRNPLIASASPLSGTVNNLRRMEDAGIGAIVIYSLFEEQITKELQEMNQHLVRGTESYAESLTYFPEPADVLVEPEEYVDHIRQAKSTVDVPVIASLNGHSEGGWVRYAKLLEDAGADALELNIYFLATDFATTSEQIEQRYLNILRSVKSMVKIPVAVKIGPYFSALAHMTKRLEEAGADGLVLFNRFYQPDIDIENLSVIPNVLLSTPQALRLPLRWIAILHGHLKMSLAATSGVHSAQDALKMIMVGADATMLCSVLLKHGIDHVDVILEDMRQWMQEHGYESIQQMKGSLSQKSCPNPEAFERANYMRALKTFI